MREDAKTWKCVICGKNVKEEVICYGCTMKTWKEQKAAPGSITRNQIYFIEKQLKHVSTETTSKIFFSVVPEYDYDIENLSTEQARSIAALLLDEVEKQSP